MPPSSKPSFSEPFRSRSKSKSEAANDDLPQYDNGTDSDSLLEVLGYESELVRTRSTWQVAFMSFVLSSVPYGLSTTLIYPLTGGGPVTIIWGWVAVCFIILCLSASLGEITSVYPTAGGVYYQTFMLAPKSSQRILAWICGWAYTLGNMIITLSVNFGTTLFLTGCINIFKDADGNGIWAAETYHTYLTFFAVTLLCNAVSAFGNRWLPKLDVCILLYRNIHSSHVMLTSLHRPLQYSGPLAESSRSYAVL